MNYDFLSSVALVTGAGSGIGKAAALLYAKHGARVIVSDIVESGGQATVEEILRLDGEAVFVKADVSQPDDCKLLVEMAVEEYGRIDFAFNNAGISGESNAIADMSVKGWNNIIAVNLSSVFYCMKYQLAQMVTQNKGAIVNMSSILGQVGYAKSAGYVAAKHGIIGLTKTAALEYSGKGIRVNAIGPGFINTPLLRNAGIDEQAKTSLAQAHPIGRLGESDEVAELVIWLSSDASSFITGSYYPVDGGYLAQ